MPGWLGSFQHRPAVPNLPHRRRNGRIIWNDKLSFPVEPMLGVVGVAPQREARHNGWAGQWGGNFDIQEVTTGAQNSTCPSTTPEHFSMLATCTPDKATARSVGEAGSRPADR